MPESVVLFTDGEYYAEGFAAGHLPRLGNVAELRFCRAETPDALIPELPGVVVLVNRRLPLTRPVFASASSLRGVVKWGVGVNHIDLDAATEHGILVANSPGNYIAVAEAALALILALSKRLLEWREAARSGRQTDSRFRGHEVYGKTLGIIGLGRIGRHLAGIARGCGMQVTAYDPYVSAERAVECGVTLMSLDAMLAGADFLSINAVLTPETHHLIGERELRLMKPTAYMINTARGSLVDERALARALREGVIAGAGLDVFEEEPLPSDHPVLHMENVIATPHALARTWESMDRTIQMIEDAVIALLEGRMPETALNRVPVKGASG